MKTVDEITSDKLRGGFYTPETLVDVCLRRVIELVGERSNLTVLEPSVGDGAFLRRLMSHSLAPHVHHFLGLEITPAEAQKCRMHAADAPFNTTIWTGSALEWAATTNDTFDVVVGNPPFVRYQFVPKRDLITIEQLGTRLHQPFRGVSNLWIPVLLGALSRLRAGGVMSIVVPAEIFTGLAAGDVRAWLLSYFTDLCIDIFEPGSFPDVLQEIVIISGRRVDLAARVMFSPVHVQFVDHQARNVIARWSHELTLGTQNWTRYLLTSRQLDALAEAQSLLSVHQFGHIAKLEVSIVTGANDFFQSALKN